MFLKMGDINVSGRGTLHRLVNVLMDAGYLTGLAIDKITEKPKARTAVSLITGPPIFMGSLFLAVAKNIYTAGSEYLHKKSYERKKT